MTTSKGVRKEIGIKIKKRAAQDSRNALAAIQKKGMIARAFQIGKPSTAEQATFDIIWGENGTHTPHPEDVAPAAAKMFAEEILKTRFMIEYYAQDE